MGKKLHGMLNLSRIPKNLITKNKNGESVIWIDVIANRNGADQYGNTHTITLYDKGQGKNIYLANLKEQEFGRPSGESYTGHTFAGAPTGDGGGSLNNDSDDLPF